MWVEEKKIYVPNWKVHRAAGGGRSQYFVLELVAIVLLKGFRKIVHIRTFYLAGEAFEF